MKKQQLYKLKADLKEGITSIFRTDNNIGYIGAVYKDGQIRNNSSYKIPNYIVQHALELMNNND